MKLLCLLLFAAAAPAQVTLTYHGRDTNLYNGPADVVQPTPCETYLCVEAVITLPARLGRNLKDAETTVSSLLVGIGSADAFVNYTGVASVAQVFFSTDANGKITAWRLYATYTTAQTVDTIVSSASGDAYVSIAPCESGPLCTVLYESQQPGTWTQSALAGPAMATDQPIPTVKGGIRPLTLR